jgi:3-isopropylmalate/(R)-2-methylmalate dehydratase small subunit
MEPITVHTGVGVPLRTSNVDTDQIIPAEYLKRITRTGFKDGLFAAWRRNADFVLNHPAFSSGSVLVAGPDFGTGSSREHAVWALQDYGFRVVLSSRFADIFHGNSSKAGLLAAQVDQPVIEEIWAHLEEQPGQSITVDLEREEVRFAGRSAPIVVDTHVRWRLLNGHDDISLTMRHTDDIDRFEQHRAVFLPTTA